MELKEVGWQIVDWIHVVQVQFSGEVFWTRYWTFGFYKRRGNFL